MAKIRKINVSETVGSNPPGNGNAVMPAGTIVVYEDTDNGVTEYLLRVHDGVTDGGVPFANAPSIEHNNDINITVDSGDSSSYTWNFGQTGNLTIPGNIRKTTDASIEVDVGGSLGNIEVWVVDELVPPGGVWRLFIGDEAYPTLGTTVQIGDTVTTSWGTPITATIVDIQQDSGNWQIYVDQDITAGFANNDTVTFSTVVTTKTWTFSQDGSLQIPGGITSNDDINITINNDDSSTYTWNFDRTGNLTAPGDITTGTNNGRFIQDCADSNTSMRWINVPQGDDTTQLIRAYTGDPKLNTEVERAQIKLNFDETEDKSGLTIRTFDQSNPNNEIDHDWLFKGDGVLQLPVGGDIVDSEGNSVLGGLDANIWVQTFVSSTPTTDFPQIATSVEYDSDGNVIALFSHLDTGGVEDGRYFSVGKYTDTGTKIWTARFAADLETDGWGLAVDNADGWIYVAGSSNAVIGDTYPVSTLTKIGSGNGSEEWSKIYDFGFASSSAVVDVDSDGNPVMVGWANNGTDRYLTVTKINKLNGNVTWTRKLDGQTNEQAYGMAVGPDGEIVAVGTVDNLNYPEPYRTIVTLTATPASDPDWTTDLLGVTSGGLTYDITFAGGVPTFSNIVDTDGNRYEGDLLVTFNASTLGPTGSTNMEVRVGTTTGEDMSDRMVVVKYASDGTIAWQKAIQFDADYDCEGADADIDSNGNIYICGQFDISGGPFPGTGIALVKFDSTGVKQWSRRVTGDCVSTATSIVVGPDDKLYISGVNGDEVAETFTWVVAKYSLDGLVEWQRFIENTDSWTFAGGLFGSESGGSNIAVRQGYVALAGGFGVFDQQAYAAVLQIPDTGNVFAAGPWSVTAANLSGTLNGTASDITVVNADLADSDNALTVSADSVNLETEVGNFLVGTVYTAPGGDNSLVNGVYSVVLGDTGTVTLPAGGTITEGYVTSNPTIQLTPASPDVASQKLVIKGGGIPNYNYTDNGININYSTNTAIVGATLTFYIYSPTYADQTLYWWIYPEGANISDPGSGTVALTGSDGTISFELDSDDNEFTIRVSPEDNNYGPGVIGVETGLINADAPTFDIEHHLHLTTGDLTETSIFLGTDNHNVRTTVNGGIEITTPNTTNNVWQFGTNGNLKLPLGNSVISNLVVAGDLSTGSQIQVGSGVEADTGIIISNSVTDSLGGGPSLESGSLVNVNGSSAYMALKTVNSLGGGGGPTLTGEEMVEVSSSGVRIGVRVTNDLGDSSPPLVAFQGWTFDNGELALPIGTVISETPSQHGLNRTKYSGTFVLDPTWFAANAGNIVNGDSFPEGVLQNYDEVTGAFSFQYFGYFVPPTTANYTFNAHADETFVFWIGSKALSGYTYANKDMYGNYNGTFPEQQTQSFTIALTAGEFYPIRIQWANSGGIGQLDVFTWANDVGQANTADFTGRVFRENTGTAKIAVNDNRSIILSTDNATDNNWTFAPNGSLTLPIGVTIDYGGGNNVQYPRIIADSGKSFSVQGQGSTGSAALAWSVDPESAGQYAAVGVTKEGGDNLAKVVLQAQSNSGDAATVKLWKFDETGALTIPGDIRSEGNINIEINLADSTLRRWSFGEDGDLTFPDATVQTTAHIQGEQVFTLDTGSTAYAPTVVDFNLLFVTSAVGYSETDPTSVTLPAGVPGQRLVIFNGYNLATLTVNPGVFGRDISSGVIAEFIYSGFDGLWMPLYGTNSPT